MQIGTIHIATSSYNLKVITVISKQKNLIQSCTRAGYQQSPSLVILCYNLE